MLDEAQVAFQLNTGLFTTLKAPKAPRPDALTLTPAALGDPVTPVESAHPSPLAAVHPSKAETPSGMFTLSSVVAFILAICLSQLVIIFGGFSGERGSAKLEAVMRWLSDVFSSGSSS